MKKTNTFKLLKKNKLGENIPNKNLIISDHHIVKYLNRLYLPKTSTLFTKIPIQDIEYYHIETINYINSWFYANNCLVETFMNMNCKNKLFLKERLKRIKLCKLRKNHISTSN